MVDFKDNKDKIHSKYTSCNYWGKIKRKKNGFCAAPLMLIVKISCPISITFTA